MVQTSPDVPNNVTTPNTDSPITADQSATTNDATTSNSSDKTADALNATAATNATSNSSDETVDAFNATAAWDNATSNIDHSLAAGSSTAASNLKEAATVEESGKVEDSDTAEESAVSKVEDQVKDDQVEVEAMSEDADTRIADMEAQIADAVSNPASEGAIVLESNITAHLANETTTSGCQPGDNVTAWWKPGEPNNMHAAIIQQLADNGDIRVSWTDGTRHYTRVSPDKVQKNGKWCA
jgi:hypothetical protein